MNSSHSVRLIESEPLDKKRRTPLSRPRSVISQYSWAELRSVQIYECGS
jgi:hypothetical protein